ncbi:MAG: alpha/beta hydrolase [Novosphingobium sp.]|nr:alpha/beta hydrolase [Novosphingobium sp.]
MAAIAPCGVQTARFRADTVTEETPGYRPSGPLDPVADQLVQFFAADPGWQALMSTPLPLVREGMRAAAVMTGEPEMQSVEDYPVPVDGGEISLRLYTPLCETEFVVVWAHGGGFALGSLDEADNFVRALAVECKAIVASVDYRLAPEHKFPTAVDDLQAAALWAARNVPELAGAKLRLVLGGDSAGANLATVVTRRLHRTDEVKVAANLLAYPGTDSPDAPSLRRFESPFLGIREIAYFLDSYLPDEASRTHPDFAPLYADNLDLLPPTFVLTAEYDILTEQAESYAAKLSEAGVPVTMHRYPGMIHGFLTLDPFLPDASAQVLGKWRQFMEGLPE